MLKSKEEISKFDLTNQIDKKIINAFMVLYVDRPIEKISIKMITDQAGLNRGTFYLHYKDIYDLLEKVESRFYNISKIIAINTVDALFNKKILENALPKIKFYESNLEHLKILLCIDGKSNLNLIMKNELKKSIVSKCQNNILENTKLNEYALEYITSAQVATIIHWIRNDMEVPLYKISGLMQDLATNGALRYFE